MLLTLGLDAACSEAHAVHPHGKGLGDPEEGVHSHRGPQLGDHCPIVRHHLPKTESCLAQPCLHNSAPVQYTTNGIKEGICDFYRN